MASSPVFILLLVLITETLGSGQISIKLKQYMNPRGKGANGNCCDGIGFICRGSCDHYFRFCFDYINGPKDDLDSCPLGMILTDVTQEQNQITFGDLIGYLTPNPFSIPVDIWPGIAKLKLQVNDWDSENENDLVEYVETSIGVSSSAFGANVTYHDMEILGRTRLDYSLAVICDQDWYGPACNVSCVPTDGPDGHFTCGPDGEKICHPGWEGEVCTENINECSSSPCVNGTCKDLVNGFSCVCDAGYTGELCGENINECASNPCQHGGQCEDAVDGYICRCQPAFSGTRCDAEVNECLSNPCMNQASCTDNIDGYTCQCLPGFTGTRCETSKPGPCSSNPCHGEARCVDNGASFTCECPVSYTGRTCSTALPHICDIAPCKNSGTCLRVGHGYRCRCAPGWADLYCQKTSTAPVPHLHLALLVIFPLLLVK